MSPFRVKNKVRRGFSLVEMAIIVAVIAIIAAIAVPTFSHVANNAKLSELKSQINDSYTKFANEQRLDGQQVSTIDAYSFVKADGFRNGSLVNPSAVYIWDGESETVDTKEFTELSSRDYLYPTKYGEFFVVRRGTR